MNPTTATVLSVLAIWRLIHLLQAEDGPWRLVARLRQRAGTGFWGELLDCFYCLSLWIAAPLAVWLGEAAADRLLLWLALSGAAILLERLTQRGEPVALQYLEDVEEEDELLRQVSPGRVGPD